MFIDQTNASIVILRLPQCISRIERAARFSRCNRLSSLRETQSPLLLYTFVSEYFPPLHWECDNGRFVRANHQRATLPHSPCTSIIRRQQENEINQLRIHEGRLALVAPSLSLSYSLTRSLYSSSSVTVIRQLIRNKYRARNNELGDTWRWMKIEDREPTLYLASGALERSSWCPESGQTPFHADRPVVCPVHDLPRKETTDTPCHVNQTEPAPAVSS